MCGETGVFQFVCIHWLYLDVPGNRESGMGIPRDRGGYAQLASRRRCFVESCIQYALYNDLFVVEALQVRADIETFILGVLR